MHAETAELSAILIVSGEFSSIRTTLDRLRQQSVAERVELVIVGAASALNEVTASQFPEFFGCRLVQVDEVESLGQAYAVGVRKSTAPVIACCEDHAFPAPTWAEELINAHRDGWAVVGPAMRNGNPDSTVSWAAFLMGFGPWATPAKAGVVTHLPWHNNSYKRDVLLHYDDTLGKMLDAESVLHWKLLERGLELYLEPKAQTDHLNVAQLGPWLKYQFFAGQKFAASRSAKWSWFRRCFYGAASFLIPPLRFWRLQKEIRRPGRCPSPMLPVVGVILLGLAADGAGQMLGYCSGFGASVAKTAEYDLHRMQYV